MSDKFLRVRAVPGRRIMDPTTLSQSTPRVVGYKRVETGNFQTNYFSGKKEPEFSFEPTGEDVLVPDPGPDFFFRKAILDGDLEYVEHVELNGENEKKRVDPTLKKASDEHKAKRLADSESLPPALSPVPSQE